MITLGDNKYYKLNSEENINFQEIFNDYIDTFTRKKLILKVANKDIEIRFSKDNLPHLLGLHKVLKGRATDILQSIVEGEIDIEKLKKHERYKEIKDRILSYNFLHSCFIDKNIELCIIVDAHGFNPQDLGLVFIDDFGGKDILFGLRKARNTNYYSPTTMYVVKDNSAYIRKKKSRVLNIRWQDY